MLHVYFHCFKSFSIFTEVLTISTNLGHLLTNEYSNQLMSLAALSSETVWTEPKWQTLKSPFGWVPDQLSRFLTNKRASRVIINHVFRQNPVRPKWAYHYQMITSLGRISRSAVENMDTCNFWIHFSILDPSGEEALQSGEGQKGPSLRRLRRCMVKAANKDRPGHFSDGKK